MANLSHIPVFYSEAMVVSIESFSPSAAKPRAVVDSWGRLGVPIDVMAPTPVSRTELARAHSPGYVDGILAGRIQNGFGTTDASVAASLLFTSGAMLSAAREALRNGQVAVAPCSGFHHANYSRAGGFCTFNGLMVTALALQASGEARRVGILDFDEHYGDGTDAIMKRLEIDWIRHYTAGGEYGNPSQVEEFLARIPELVSEMTDCDVLLYQAGADPHVDDPLGGWLSTDELAERDRRVFEAAASIGLPVAWNLAGGYQSPLRRVLDIHDNTLLACAAVYVAGRSGRECQEALATRENVS